MNPNLPPYYDEPDDVDAMSGYKQAQAHAEKKHTEAIAKGSWWKTLFAIIITVLLMWWMSGCSFPKDHQVTATLLITYTDGQRVQ